MAEAHLHGPGPLIGIISNPRSHANHRGRTALGDAVGGLPYRAPENRDALQAALAGFSAAGVSILVVHGGDGTLREVLSALPLAWGGPPPGIAPLPAGRTNLAARTLGSTGAGEAGLRRLMMAASAGRLRWQARPVIEVTGHVGDFPATLRGLLFGAAAFTEATRLAERKRQRGKGLKDNAVVAVTGLLVAMQALAGKGELGHALRQGIAMQVSRDGAPDIAGDRFILLATTLDRLMLGLWPFWGDGPGGLRVLDVVAPPGRLGAGLWSLLRHRPPSLPGWHSGRAARLHIGLRQPFVLDGELFQPGPDGIQLTASAPVDFVAA
jgi:hypothetical protein